MSVENSSWFNDLKYGSIFQRLQNFTLVVRLLISILAAELIAIGVTVLTAAHVFKNQTGFSLKQLLLDSSNFAAADQIWKAAWTLKTLNIDECMEQLIESFYNGFSVVLVTGLISLLVVFCRSNAVDYTAVLFLLLAMGLQSRDLKSFDNVLTPLQNKTMTRMRAAILDNQLSLKRDFVAAVDFLMVQGGCCGLISGTDMSLFLPGFKRRVQNRMGDKKHENFYTLISPCWTVNPNVSKTTGCYVHYFERTVKPKVRFMYGMAFLAQIVLLALILIQSEVPAAKQDALRIMFRDRLPTPFPID